MGSKEDYLTSICTQPPDSWCIGWAASYQGTDSWHFCCNGYALLQTDHYTPEQLHDEIGGNSELLAEVLQKEFGFNLIVAKTLVSNNDGAGSQKAAINTILETVNKYEKTGLLYESKSK